MASRPSKKIPTTGELLDVSGRGLWSALAEDTESKAAILSTRGEVLLSNELAAQTLGRRPEELIGRRLIDFCPEETHAPITQWFTSIRESSSRQRENAATYMIWGCQWRSTGRLIQLANRATALLCVGRRVIEPRSIGRLISLVHKFSDRQMVLGELSILSDRELEVAALIGAGMTDAEVASEIHRSVRTVHAHRRSIGQKLRIGRRAELLRAMVMRGIIGETKPGSSR